jgi:hypothetical protein
MIDSIPVDTLYYTTIVTRDAKAAAKKHSEFYGIKKWKVARLTPDRLSHTSWQGRGRGRANNDGLHGDTPPGGEFGLMMVNGLTDDGSVEFQLVQPISGMSTFEQFLCTRGMGVHGVFMSVMNAGDFAALKAFLKGEGIPIAQSFAIEGVAEFHYLDTRKALGGFYVQVVVPLRSDWEAEMPCDEVWDFSPDVAQQDEACSAIRRTTAIPHFGVIVHDLHAHLGNFAKLFKTDIWRGMNWRTEAGSLEDTTNNGKPVVHSYFTGRADIGKTKSGAPFGFEVVQPCFGPSHYKEDFLLVLGPGIHHVDLNFPVTDWPEWEKVNGWLNETFEAPCCMSGWLRGRSALFQYQDTRKTLGYVTEIHAPRPPGFNGPKMRWAPDYWYDFGAPAVS